MPTTQREVLAVVEQRLKASPELLDHSDERIRVSHRTPVDRAKTPAIHVIPLDVSSTGKRDGDCVRRRLIFAVRVMGRGDEGIAVIDALIAQVLARLQPGAADAIPYPAGVMVGEPGRVKFDEEDADADVATAEFEVTVDYSSAEWSI